MGLYSKRRGHQHSAEDLVNSSKSLGLSLSLTEEGMPRNEVEPRAADPVLLPERSSCLRDGLEFYRRDPRSRW